MLWIHLTVTALLTAGFPPFGHPRLVGYVLLNVAFRSLSRPSSAPSAKAFALCSLFLDLHECFRISFLFCSLSELKRMLFFEIAFIKKFLLCLIFALYSFLLYVVFNDHCMTLGHTKENSTMTSCSLERR